MAERAILFVWRDNASLDRPLSKGEEVFDKLTSDLLDLAVAERGLDAPGYALPAFPLCCSIVLCSSCSCSRNLTD